MAGITLTQAQAQLDAYLEAEKAVLSNQAYEIAGRKLTRADLSSIQAGIKAWNARVIDLSGAARGRSRRRTIVAG
jgi:phage FluMu protein gp41